MAKTGTHGGASRPSGGGSPPSTPTPSLSLPQRIAPVLGLLFLAPWVGEFLLGGISARYLGELPLLVPLYGGGALLIREVTRRTGRGWPTILALGLAYGLIEAGLVDQSLFNTSFTGLAGEEATLVPALGVSAYSAITYLAGHVIWSIGIPIALVELLTPARGTTPWLGRVGLALVGVLYLFGCVFSFGWVYLGEGFIAAPAQLICVAALTLVLICGAFALKESPTSLTNRRVPKPLLLGIGTFVVASIFVGRPQTWAGGVVGGLLILGVAFTALSFWSRQRGWTIEHQFALVAGTLLTYAWLGFVLTALTAPADPVAWVGNMVFALIAVLLLVVIGKRLKQARSDMPGRET